jgi:hypothetical protein
MHKKVDRIAPINVIIANELMTDKCSDYMYGDTFYDRHKNTARQYFLKIIYHVAAYAELAYHSHSLLDRLTVLYFIVSI